MLPFWPSLPRVECSNVDVYCTNVVYFTPPSRHLQPLPLLGKPFIWRCSRNGMLSPCPKPRPSFPNGLRHPRLEATYLFLPRRRRAPPPRSPPPPSRSARVHWRPVRRRRRDQNPRQLLDLRHPLTWRDLCRKNSRSSTISSSRESMLRTPTTSKPSTRCSSRR